MRWDVTGLGNALMDALVVVEDDGIIGELGLTRGVMHPVDHERWTQVYEQVRDNKVTFDSGGSCANTIATIGRLGGKSVYAGQVGEDQMGHLYASLMEKACGAHAIRFSRESATGKCLSIISAKDAERTMVTDLGAAVKLPELGEFSKAIQSTKIAHFEGYTLLEGPTRPVVLEAMAIAKASGALISLDASDPFVVGLLRDMMWDVLDRFVDIAFLNAEEARHLTEASPEDAVHEIARRAKVRTIVVKLGGRGSMVWADNELYNIDIHRVKAIDTTGAGDSYAGGFLYGLVQGFDPARCGRLAARVAGLAVAQVGATVKDLDSLKYVVGESAAL